jgi:hypothetical protein
VFGLKKNFSFGVLGLLALSIGTGSLRADDRMFPALESDWEPSVEFTDKSSGNLAVRVNPLSPNTCGVAVIEVGVKDPVTSRFEPHLALLRDTFDQTFPGIAPKIRRIYSYNMPVSINKKLVERPAYMKGRTVVVPKMALPPVVVDADHFRAEILGKLLFLLTRTVVTTMGNPIASAGVLTVDQFVEHIIKKRAFFRSQAVYMLQLIASSSNQELKKYFAPGELERLIAVGADAEYKDILISKDYQDFVYLAQNDQVRQTRVQNFANLLFSLNREGLIAQPLFRDFVMVYYDPKKEYARKIDLAYTDFVVSPESAVLQKRALVTKKGLLPLGIFAIGGSADRLLQYDFLKPERMSEREWAQYLARLGRNIGTAFIPFPFSLMVTVTKSGAEFVLKKAGKDILVDKLKTEGELLALLNSGVVSLDPQLVATVKSQLESSKEQALLTNDMIGMALPDHGGERIADFRQQHDANMNAYLRKRGSSLCKEVSALREGEFRDEYLSFGESFERGFQNFLKFFGFSSDDEYKEERKQIIQARTRLIEARRVLNSYNPFILFQFNDKIIESLQVVAQARDPQDVELLGHAMRKFSDPELLSATMKAAMDHGNGNLYSPIVAYLEKFDPKLDIGVSLAVGDAIMALSRLNMSTADDPDEATKQSLRVLKVLNTAKSRSVRFLANEGLYQVNRQLVDMNHL